MATTARSPSTGRFPRVVGFALGVGSTPSGVDAALVATRVALAWFFVYYGAGKLFGAFHGPGLHRTALYFSQVAHLHPGGFFAVLGGLIEFAGGLAVALGLATRLAGLALFGDMVVAMVTVTWSTGIASVSPPPGYQLNIALAVLSLVLALLGPGRLSLDALLVERWVARVNPGGRGGSRAAP